MGHPSDWDAIRRELQEQCLANSTATDIVTHAIAIRPAQDWHASLQQLAEAIPPKSILVGYSMGARLALGLAIDFPDLCRGLVFISGNPGLESNAHREQRAETDRQVAKRIGSQSPEEFLTNWYQQGVFSAVPDAIVRSEITTKLQQDSQHWPAILRANSIAHQPNYWVHLDRLPSPMLAIAGELDTKYCEIATRLASEAPDRITSKIIGDCGHIVHREHPQVLCKALADFIERLETS